MLSQALLQQRLYTLFAHRLPGVALQAVEIDQSYNAFKDSAEHTTYYFLSLFLTPLSIYNHVYNFFTLISNCTRLRQDFSLDVIFLNF